MLISYRHAAFATEWCTDPITKFRIAAVSIVVRMDTHSAHAYSVHGDRDEQLRFMCHEALKEPMAIAFDGDGKMYVVEMRTYMQDIDGTDELTPKSRISLHESTKADGVFANHRVYHDNILLPRMVLLLDYRVLGAMTHQIDLTLHLDA